MAGAVGLMLCLGGHLDLEAKTFQRNFKGEFYPFLQALGPPKKAHAGAAPRMQTATLARGSQNTHLGRLPAPPRPCQPPPGDEPGGGGCGVETNPKN